MQECKWCQIAQETSTDKNGKCLVIMCRPCFRRKRKLEAAKRSQTQTKK